MGIDRSTLAFLRDVHSRGIDFTRTLTVGRQELHGTGRGFAEPLLRSLGAVDVDSLDASPYEGATVVADLNTPLPADLVARYTVVFDGGTLEHIFDLPQALTNLLRLVEPGGHFIGAYPANNQIGHGLYQFSPELFFRAFQETNGFLIERLLVVERSWWTRAPRRAWEVRDPAVVGARLELGGRRPAELYVLARRVGPVPEKLTVGPQSSYEEAWRQPTRRLRQRAVESLPWPVPPIVSELLRRARRRQAYRSLRHKAER